MEQLLKRLGMRKATLARELGIKPGTVYRWTEDTCPKHVIAYLELKVLYVEKTVSSSAGEETGPVASANSG